MSQEGPRASSRARSATADPRDARAVRRRRPRWSSPATGARSRKFLRDDPRCAMNMFVDLCGGRLSRSASRASRWCCTCRSLNTGHRLRLKTRVGDERRRRRRDRLAWSPSGRAPTGSSARRSTCSASASRAPRSAPHPDVPGVRRASAAQGLPGRQDPAAHRRTARGTLEKLAARSAGDEGMSFGRQTHDSGIAETRSTN